ESEDGEAVEVCGACVEDGRRGPVGAGAGERIEAFVVAGDEDGRGGDGLQGVDGFGESVVRFGEVAGEEEGVGVAGAGCEGGAGGEVAVEIAGQEEAHGGW